MSSGEGRCIGVYSPDPLETRAFLAFTRHFHSKGLNVPGLLSDDTEKSIYLLEDLGDLSLKKIIDRERKGKAFPAGVIPLYRSALSHLVDFQLEGHRGMDYTVCVPRQEFDRQSVLWDLNHFKYYFIRLLNVPANEQKLEDDFGRLADYLLGAGRNHFMFRDFQSRNIMVRGNELYFIDYQGGRRGALQYDVASLLFEAITDLPVSLREELLDHYLATLGARSGKAADGFMEQFYGYVLIRILQAMGAYGLRGIIEKKAVFLQSVPYAIRNVKWLLENSLVPDHIPELKRCLGHICGLKDWAELPETGSSSLRISINSFSYSAGPPGDLTGNGGGFVFDCRALPNPGRLEEYSHLTGKDPEVAGYLRDKQEVERFMKGVSEMVSQSIETYLARGFTDLMVNFGCTGGRHRSVYCAERLNEFLKGREGVEIVLNHKELSGQAT